jgi:hypothetical protein
MEEAQWHASSLKLGRVQMARNQGGQGIVSPEELRFLEHSGMRATTGDSASVSAELDEIADRYATDHLGIVTICYDFKARLRSYELLAEHYLSE